MKDDAVSISPSSFMPSISRWRRRDEFPEGVKRVVAFRAGHQCSFEGCTQRTSGPSNESDRSVTNVGDVAHIVAASPGGRRSDASMTAEERKSIGNARLGLTEFLVGDFVALVSYIDRFSRCDRATATS